MHSGACRFRTINAPAEVKAVVVGYLCNLDIVHQSVAVKVDGRLFVWLRIKMGINEEWIEDASDEASGRGKC